MMKLLYLFSCFLLSLSLSAQSFTLTSPDGHLKSSINIKEKITYDLLLDGKTIVSASPLSITLQSGETWGHRSKLKKSTTKKINNSIQSPFYKKDVVADHYNELNLAFDNDWGLTFRMYNDGLAYRFVNNKASAFNIQSEEVSFNFPENYSATVPYVKQDPVGSIESQFFNSFENIYANAALSGLDTGRLIFLPMLVNISDDVKICITESDLEDYPGLYLRGNNTNTLNGVFAAYPKQVIQGGHNMLQMLVQQRENYIAKINGKRSLPWRAIIVSTSDKQLLDNDMSYKLAAPSRLTDLSYIKPGKVAWDWWNDWNITGVDFEAGVNNKTYEYYIDFASKNNIEYVIMDEGWAVNKQADLLQVIPEIDLKHIIDYGKQRNVGIILWAGYHAFDRDMENVCRHYSQMGVKGFKVDFMDRDDQQMVSFVKRAAETAAKYKLMLDFHGIYKPAGLNRTYPNVINFEGVFGLEQMKWAPASVDMVTNDVTIPFTRMVAGPLDYTPGAMRNAIKANYTPIWNQPMSQGTRCRQLALFGIFESPLTMLSDSPSEYLKEKESLDFLTAVPTTWDETIALDGKVQQFVCIARRKGNDWYVSGLTNWDTRNIQVDLSFLPWNGRYEMTLFKDGVNAHRNASDYIKEVKTVSAADKINIVMQPGGGFIMRLKK